MSLTISRYLKNKGMHRQTLSLAIPMIVSNLSVPLTGLVDTAVIGHLEHPHYLAATAIGSMIMTLIMWAMGFLRMGTTGLSAQAFGEMNKEGIQRSLLNSFLLALIISIGILLFHSFIWQASIYFIHGSEQALLYGEIYFDIRIWSTPALLIRFVFIGWLLGMQNAKVPLLILLTSNIINIVLDLLFVVHFEWGVAGAAWASVIADYCGLLVGVIGVLSVIKVHAMSQHWLASLNKTSFFELLNLNRDIFVRTLALEAVFYIQTAVGASLGDKVLAANAILMNFVLLLSYGLDGFAHAVEALTGKAKGARDFYQFKSALWVTSFWSVISSVLYMMIYFVFGEELIALMTNIDVVKTIAHDYLIYLVIIPLIAVWSYWLDGIFIGLTRAKEMRNSMLFSVVFVFVPLCLTVPMIGNHGLWIAFCGFMVIRAISLAFYLYKIDITESYVK